MAQHDDGRIREYDEDGRLVAAGLRWWEGKEWLEQLTPILAVPPTLLAGIAFIGMSHNSTSYAAFYTFCGAAACVVASFIPLVLWGKTTRSLVFHIDGRIEVPEGLPFLSRDMRQLLDQSQFLSIEAESATVRIWFRGGQSATLFGRNIPIQLARLVTIQLNSAFQEIKDARMALNEQRAPAARPVATQPVIN